MQLKLSKKQWAGILALAVALGPISGVTTRAQGDEKGSEGVALIEIISAERMEARARSQKGIEALKAELGAIDEEIEKLEEQLTVAADRLPGALRYTDDINIRGLRRTPGTAAELDGLVELFRKAKERYDTACSLRKLLESQEDPSVRMQILLTKKFDANLSQLIGRKQSVEQQLVVQQRTLTSENPRVQETKALLETINSHIDDIVKGIMVAMNSDLKIASEQLARLTEEIVAKTSGASFRFEDERFSEFAEDFRMLQYKRRLREAIRMRLRRETVDAAIPESKGIHKTLMIDRNGSLELDGRRLEKEELAAVLQLAADSTERDWHISWVTLKAHPKTPFEDFQEIYQLCRDAGAQVVISTDR